MEFLQGAKTRFKDNMPGFKWFRLFLARHPKLSERRAQNVKRVRAGVTKEILTSYFKELEKSLEEVPPTNIINYDETNFTDDPGASKVSTSFY